MVSIESLGQIDWKFLLLSFRGRIGRIHFWLAFLLLLAVGAALQFIPILGQLLTLALFWPHLALQAKRLHDMGRTAWFIAVPPSVFFVCGVAGALIGGPIIVAATRRSDSGALVEAAGGVDLIAAMLVLPAIVLAAFLLWLGLTRSQPGDNRFGPPAQVP